MPNPPHLLIVSLVLAIAAAAMPARGEVGSVFQRPALHETQSAAARALRRDEADRALGLLEPLARRDSDDPVTQALLAATLGALGREEEAAAALARAAEAPDPDPADPYPVTDRAAVVRESNTRWSPQTGLLDSAFVFPPIPTLDRGPILRDEPWSPATRLLASLRRRGAAAGHRGDVYDNRDDAHSAFDIGRFPQLSHSWYSPEARGVGLHYGLNDRLRFGAIVFGNASVALVSGPRARSLPRMAMTNPASTARMALLYAANHVYVYPEHRDHDPKFGDLFPAATPYALISQGSSGSDRPLLERVALMLAALRPDVKAALRSHGLIAPTMQMLLRRARVGGDAALYMSGRAHPSAFDGNAIDPLALVRAANALTLDAIPGAPALTVAAEQGGGPILGDGLGERLFDTPGAVARIARGVGRTRIYTLDASATVDPNGRPLRFHWRVLRGDPARVSVEPLDEAGTQARVVVDWSERRLAPGRDDLPTDRVEIGLFADNGAALSAPAFFTVYFPPRQSRRYAEDGRLLSIDFAAPDRADRYEDPRLIPARGWSDTLDYDDSGRLLGWTRRRDGEERRYARDGARVLERDTLNRPIHAEVVAYPVGYGADGGLRVEEVPTGMVLTYEYAGSQDRIGRVASAKRR